MVTHSQIIHEISIKKLKNISQVSINLEGSPLISLMGVNGCGKSTILYALCCVYKPLRKEDENYKFSRFFPPHNHFNWTGSYLSINYSFSDDTHKYFHAIKDYSKKDRWVIYERRPERYVKFVEIKTCVPVIESENKGQKIQYTTATQSNELDILIRQKAGYILNKDYDSLHVHTYDNKTIIGVKVGTTQYSALTMGAGEQRVFTILDAVFRTPYNSSLILIDEIDLLLHPQALKKLITVIYDRAIEKHHQIIFTSHNTELFELKDKVELRHIHQTEQHTVCMANTTPDITRRMTGKQIKSIEIYVEDNLAQAIVSHICRLCGVSKDVVIYKYGAATNVFTISGGLALSRQSIDSALFVLDGDVFVTEEEKKKQIKKVVTGHGLEIDNLRDRLLTHLTQFNLPKNAKPEKFIFNCIRNIQTQIDYESEEIKALVSDIINAGDHHNLVKVLVEQMGCSEEIGLNSIIRVFSQTPEWSNFSEPIKVWLTKKKHELYG
ncbi:ATP-dependent nuclease [Anabaena azotica]|uniref:AAA family ATPase n=1 Tax=Anabaena azotica FACHB-119 TaxID=947527 RepID=A0ABR8DFW8_9NOST|nr:AAA family ATPase [Anabaena azotica]MBD2505511.1 AAA family ATPase [Anabaena azotica FACHB-119]